MSWFRRNTRDNRDIGFGQQLDRALGDERFRRSQAIVAAQNAARQAQSAAWTEAARKRAEYDEWRSRTRLPHEFQLSVVERAGVRGLLDEVRRRHLLANKLTVAKVAGEFAIWQWADHGFADDESGQSYKDQGGSNSINGYIVRRKDKEPPSSFGNDPRGLFAGFFNGRYVVGWMTGYSEPGLSAGDLRVENRGEEYTAGPPPEVVDPGSGHWPLTTGQESQEAALTASVRDYTARYLVPAVVTLQREGFRLFG